MDSEQFDALVSRLSAHVPRRRSLSLLGALGASAAGLVSETDAKKRKKKKKKKPTVPGARRLCGWEQALQRDVHSH